ncbi:spermidine synthase [Horticoccus sp. 23ND18S-11]|uniref:spermidine synthase n=1 Tax=Horticoccus sp. 23ND18S-11 TaxID=3391832 RepID=UPI0039C949D7
MLPYALTIFTGAFLLFQVQPLIGKYILPWFGGGPGVWTTCLLFFQTVLLGGYAYAHFSSTRLTPRRQVIVHFILLALSLALLPITPSESWKAHVGGDPNVRILLLLMATIGLPYFVLSSTGPLMQQWFSQTNPGVSPYRLYALSNVGSLLALLSYPIYFEVKFPRHTQAAMWSGGLALFVVFCGYCAFRVWRHVQAPVAPTTAPDAASPAPAEETKVSAIDKILWVALPAFASVLLLATTNKLSQEVAVIPFLWVLPLSLYLLTFIICFDHARWYHRGIFTSLLIVGTAVVCQVLPVGTDASMRLQIIAYTATLFVACMVCHGELYRLKPPPRLLTSYFLFISAGGALGGFFVAIVAPALFTDYRELQLGLWILTYALGVLCFRHRSRELAIAVGVGALASTVALPWLRSFFDDTPGLQAEFVTFFRDRAWYIIGGLVLFVGCLFDLRRRVLLPTFQPRMGGFVMAVCVAFGAVFVLQWNDRSSVRTLSATRNFYGTLKVFDHYPDDPEDHYHLLLHGATTHGIQFVKPEKAMLPTTYYADSSGVGRGISSLPETPRRLGLVGLGTGSLATYARPGDYLRIYEINPAVQELARSQFKYLEYCQAKTDVIMGDARLMMEQELAANQGQQFDFLALDAFSSDAIPVHLLTKEAFEIYFRHLKADGVLAVHISNRYLDLRPVVEKLAEHFKLEVVTISDDNEPDWWIYATTWMLVTKNKAFLTNDRITDTAEKPSETRTSFPLWTDDYASLYSIMKQ